MLNQSPTALHCSLLLGRPCGKHLWIEAHRATLPEAWAKVRLAPGKCAGASSEIIHHMGCCLTNLPFAKRLLPALAADFWIKVLASRLIPTRDMPHLAKRNLCSADFSSLGVRLRTCKRRLLPSTPMKRTQGRDSPNHLRFSRLLSGAPPGLYHHLRPAG